MMRALVLDGYTDEPACLGVPPFISPYVRLAFGAISAAGVETRYATVDQWRAGVVDSSRYDLLAIVRNVSVPGKYLRGMPASDRELSRIADDFNGTIAASLGLDPRRLPAELRGKVDYLSSADFDASLHDLIVERHWTERRRTSVEWESWLRSGARACAMHPDAGGPLIAEVQMYRGCVRYISGGCDFCIEPLFGDVLFRPVDAIIDEVRALSAQGVRNLRLGAQSCVYCYMSKDVGDSETPTPNAEEIDKLLRGVEENARPEVFHLDNANPAVIAEHPSESRDVTKSIARHCTSGNVLAFGLESADRVVRKRNNLNATPEQTMEAVRIVNSVGATRGPTGLPLVLPGINFVCGLKGETKDTYRLNLEFLKEVVSEGLLLRRINIRQVLPIRGDFPGIASKADFARFKRAVREEVDAPLLEKLVPDRTVLTGVYAELREGGRTFGRQVGTYPLLVSVPYPVEPGTRMNVCVTGRGFRSVEGIVHPMDVNTATLSMLQSIPGIGKKRAMAIVRARPFHDAERLWKLLDDPAILDSAQFHLSVGKVDDVQ